MLAVFDIDGNVDAAPTQMQGIMTALKAAGWTVEILSGVTGVATQADFENKSNYLNSLGCGQCWDHMTVVSHPTGDVAGAKAQWLSEHGADVFIDNSKSNAKQAIKAGVPLVLVPWASRTD